MSKRPSFQFYPADWSANPNLKRCTFAEKGIWLEVMCLLHDQPEYGVLHWTLQEVATAVRCRISDLRSLQRKGVMKGDDEVLADPFIYTPRSGRKDGPPVTLVPAQDGPIWFSSRMVKDEYVRCLRAEGGAPDSPKDTPKQAPKPPIGVAFGPRGSSSSSPSSQKGSEDKSSGAESAALADPDKTAWTEGVGLLVKAGGMTDRNARSFFGKLLSDNGLIARDLLGPVAEAIASATLEPAALLRKSAEGKARRRADREPRRVGFV